MFMVDSSLAFTTVAKVRT